MRKNYMKPDCSQVVFVSSGIICGSNDPVQSNNGLGFGGTDSQGEREPEARRNVWDDAGD